MDKQGDQHASAEWPDPTDFLAEEIRADEIPTFAPQTLTTLNGQDTNAAVDGLFKTLEPEATTRGGVYTEDDALAF